MKIFHQNSHAGKTIHQSVYSVTDCDHSTILHFTLIEFSCCAIHYFAIYIIYSKIPTLHTLIQNPLQADSFSKYKTTVIPNKQYTVFNCVKSNYAHFIRNYFSLIYINTMLLFLPCPKFHRETFLSAHLNHS